jgi:acyl carrier protein phosphodiesterase
LFRNSDLGFELYLYQPIMNYLAHLFLASDKGNAKLGGLLADFVRGDAKQHYSADIQYEIHMHRLIDAYTDAHPTVLKSKKLVEEKKRRYMGIVLDVFYDHKLAQNWDRYSDISLSEFVQKTYQLLHDNRALLPVMVRGFTTYMIQEDWLASYKEMPGFTRAIRRLSRRVTRGHIMSDCIADVEGNYAALSAGFDKFFPQLIGYVQKQRMEQGVS